MKKTSLPLNPPRPGPGQFSFEQFEQWAAANNRPAVALPRFSPYAKPPRNDLSKFLLPQKTAPQGLKASPQLEEIMRRKQQEQETE